MTILFITLTALLFPGVINITRSNLSGRRGPDLFQPVKDLLRLFRKGSVYSRTTGLLFRVAPAISLASVLCAAMVLPLGPWKAIISFKGDFIFFIYILALGRFMTIAAAMDTGSSFEGMGSSREALFGMLSEPVILVLVGALVLFTGHYSFSEIFALMHDGSNFSYGLGIMSVFLLFMFTLVESCRVPVDDPRTHLELTMIHEVMILDNSGFDLALVELAGMLKFGIFGAIMANFFLQGFSLWAAVLLFVAGQAVFAMLIGFVESFMARLRISHNPQFVMSLNSLAFLIFIGVLMFLQN